MLALVLGVACTQSAPAQTFKPVKVKGGATLIQIAAGGKSVWALARSGHPYIFNGKQFVLANNIYLCQIAVGGGNLLQPDAVWGIDCSGNVYTATKSGTTWVFSQVPGFLAGSIPGSIAVGIGYQDVCHPSEVWGLNPAALIFRFNFCNQNWDNVPGSLVGLAVGGGDVWGYNGVAELYRFDFSQQSFQLVTGDFGEVEQLTVGPNGVWASVDGGKIYGVYSYNDPYHGPRYTLDPVSGKSIQLKAGGDGVWGIGPAQQIYRLDSDLAAFVQIPGALVSISVGSGGGVWGIDGAGKPYAFSTP
jgi:hypothetical protein